MDEPSTQFRYFIIFETSRYNEGKISHFGTKVILVTHLVSDIIPEMNRFIFLKGGKIFADGKRSEVFTCDKLSSLFDMKVELVENNGLFQITAA